MSKPNYSEKQFDADYPDDDACLQALFISRYESLSYCPGCGVVDMNFYRVTGRKCYACVHCRYQIHPLAGTIFHKSSTPLRLWFKAIYMFSIRRNGVSAAALSRQLGVTYKTAWRMAMLIRSSCTQGDELLKGVVEADEAYIGGRRRSSNRFSNKTPLLGAVERGGSIRVQALDDSPTTRDITTFIGTHVLAGSILHTDESHLYKRVEKVYERRSVKHGAFEFVRDSDYTNTIEGFWGIFKPYLDGTHRHVSKKYLQLYVNEAVRKYNHRQQLLFPLLLESVVQRV